MTIRVHHLKISRSTRIIWLMEELGLPYDLVQHTRGADFRSPPSLYDVHPLGKAPAVEVDGRVMVESSAIIEYIVDRHGGGGLLPPDSGRAEYIEWLHFAEGTLGMPMLMRLLGPRLGLPDAALGFMDAELKKQMDWIEAQLDGKAFLCGDAFTGADINLEYLLEHAEQLGLLASRPNLTRYLADLQARPAYRKAIEIGGPVTLPRS
ncbi:MAG: glutathione S-transferase family protein [Sphingomonadales bacterium]|nr:glutathione S-transferase family protein [Sphingomonadales bacterium]